jgi:hypothetical protein
MQKMREDIPAMFAMTPTVLGFLSLPVVGDSNKFKKRRRRHKKHKVVGQVVARYCSGTLSRSVILSSLSLSNFR